MGHIIGNINKLAFDLGLPSDELTNSQHIDMWIGGDKVTRIDNLAYMPSFIPHLDKEIGKLKSLDFFNERLVGLNDEESFVELDYSRGEFHKVLCYDDTINNAIVYMVEEKECKLIYAFHDPCTGKRGEVCSICIRKDDVINVLELLLAELRNTWNF